MLALKRQDMRSYTPAQTGLWQQLFDEMSTRVWPGRVCDEYLECLAKLPISWDAIPDLREVSAALQAATGWQIVQVGGFASAHDLVNCFVRRRFPVCVNMRDPAKKDFADMPDIWHDVIGHSVLLMHPVFAQCMYEYGLQGKIAIRQGTLALCDRVFYQTEVGILKTPQGFRLYGPAAISSKAEALNCLDSKTKRLPFNVGDILQIPTTDAHVQDHYYYIESFSHLLRIMQEDWTPLYQKAASQTCSA
jgi:phenylalanine-4-hydroxylase